MKLPLIRLRNPWPIGKVFEMQKQWSVEVATCISKWAHGGRDSNEMTWKTQLTGWTNEPVQRSNEHTDEWVRWGEKRWREVRWGDWLSDWVTERFSDWATEWLTEYVRACVSELERPLRWGASSPSYFFSGQPLICTTSALNCLQLPVTSSVACTARFFSSRPAKCALQPPPTIPHSTRVALWSKWQYHWCFPSRANAFWHTTCKPA